MLLVISWFFDILLPLGSSYRVISSTEGKQARLWQNNARLLTPNASQFSVLNKNALRVFEKEITPLGSERTVSQLKYRTAT